MLSKHKECAPGTGRSAVYSAGSLAHASMQSSHASQSSSRLALAMAACSQRGEREFKQTAFIIALACRHALLQGLSEAESRIGHKSED